ncbi:MAG: PaaI family thioesterase [Chloroflexi bacterium]|nr:PaaI family thioesterase [Chloroflexota bacterium]
MTQGNTYSSQSAEPGSFRDLLGTEVVERGNGRAKVRMAIQPRHLQGAGVVQGGILMALADQAISGALGSLSPGGPVVTIEMKVNFIAPAREGVLLGEGWITHKGNLVAVGEATITDSEGRLIAQALGTWITPRTTSP